MIFRIVEGIHLPNQWLVAIRTKIRRFSIISIKPETLLCKCTITVTLHLTNEICLSPLNELKKDIFQVLANRDLQHDRS